MTKRYVRGWGNTWDNRLPRADKNLHAALQALDDDDGKLVVNPELTHTQRGLKHTIEWHIRQARTGIDVLQTEAVYEPLQESQTQD